MLLGDILVRPRKGLPRPVYASGRPLLEMDWNVVDKLLKCGCEGKEVASRLGMSPRTFYDRVQVEKGCTFTHYAQEKKSEGISLLREKQFDEAMKGNTQLLLRLGEYNLGQGKSTNSQSQLHELLEQNKAGGSEEPSMAIDEPLPHQEQPGPEDSIQTELGSIRVDWNPSQI